MSTQELTQEQIRLIGLEVLARELGATGLVRFLQMYEQGSGDYARARASILANQTVTQIAERITRQRNEGQEQ